MSRALQVSPHVDRACITGEVLQGRQPTPRWLKQHDRPSKPARNPSKTCVHDMNCARVGRRPCLSIFALIRSAVRSTPRHGVPSKRHGPARVGFSCSRSLIIRPRAPAPRLSCPVLASPRGRLCTLPFRTRPRDLRKTTTQQATSASKGICRMRPLAARSGVGEGGMDGCGLNNRLGPTAPPQRPRRHHSSFSLACLGASSPTHTHPWYSPTLTSAT